MRAALLLLIPSALGDYRWEKTLIKRGVECNSDDRSFGKQSSVDECAQRCFESRSCRFFIFGINGTKAGDCYAENTHSPECVEGWEEDSFNFYELKAQHIGCAEPGAKNHGEPGVVVDDGSCDERSPCVEHNPDGDCQKWRTWCQQPCAFENYNYRNKQNDTVYAAKVKKGAIKVDGDLSDWVGHNPAWRFQDVAFANKRGEEVMFESSAGGKWYGPDDFSMSWMLAYDETNFYIAIDVTDDHLMTGSPSDGQNTFCWKTGVQMGFEVGGPESMSYGRSNSGVLQAKRSDDQNISMFNLINMGFFRDQSSCLSTPTYFVRGGGETQVRRECCVEYVMHNGGGWAHLSSVAIIRNENNKHTYYEAAISNIDLLGEARELWQEGLTFGFSMVVSDGDEEAKQEGWGGYYPYGLLEAWNQGKMHPQNAGVVRLAGPSPLSQSHNDEGGGSFWWGVFWTLILLFVYHAFLKYREGGVTAVKEWVISFIPSKLQEKLFISRMVPTRRGPALANADFNSGSYNAPIAPSPNSNPILPSAAPIVAPTD